MQLGKALVGAILGAAVGIAVLIAVQHYKQLDQTWLAIVVALFVGLGVRTMVSTTGHESYVRGALTCALALAAYFGGMQLYSQLAQRGILAKQLPSPPVMAPDEAGDPAGTEAEADGVPVPVEPVANPTPEARAPLPSMPKAGPPQAGSPWDYVWLIAGALIAYQLGRGSAASVPKEPVVPPPDAT
jgi:hypothetical protein